MKIFTAIFAGMMGAVTAAPEFMKDLQPVQCKDLNFTVYSDAECKTESPDDTKAQMNNFNNTIMEREYNCYDSSTDLSKLSTRTTCSKTQLPSNTYTSSNCEGDNPIETIIKFDECYSLGGGNTKFIKMSFKYPDNPPPTPDPDPKKDARSLIAAVAAATLGLLATQF